MVLVSRTTFDVPSKAFQGSRNNGGMGKCKKIPKFTRASIPLPVADARSFSRGTFWAGRTLFCDDDDVIESISVHRQKLGVWFRFIHVFKSKTIADDAHNSHSQDTRFRARISNTRGDHGRQL